MNIQGKEFHQLFSFHNEFDDVLVQLLQSSENTGSEIKGPFAVTVEGFDGATRPDPINEVYPTLPEALKRFQELMQVEVLAAVEEAG